MLDITKRVNKFRLKKEGNKRTAFCIAKLKEAYERTLLVSIFTNRSILVAVFSIVHKLSKQENGKRAFKS